MHKCEMNSPFSFYSYLKSIVLYALQKTFIIFSIYLTTLIEGLLCKGCRKMSRIWVLPSIWEGGGKGHKLIQGLTY